MSTRRMAWMLFAVAGLLYAATLPAATNTWTGGAGGSGTSWNTPANWDSGKVPASMDEAAFNAAATQNKTVTLDTPQSVLQLRISGAPTNLTLGSASDVSAGNTLTLGTIVCDATAMTQTIASAVVVAPIRGSTTWNVANSAGLLIDAGTISARGTIFEKTGNGTLILNGNDAFGDVVGSGAGSTGNALTLNGNNILSNLIANGTTIYLTGSNTLSGVSVLGGTLVLSNANALGSSGIVRFGGGVLRLFDTTDLSGRFSQDSNQYYSVDTPTNVTLFATPLTSIGGSLSKKGNGTLALAASNSYSGPTTLSAGVLTISGAGTLGSSTSPLTLSGGTLDLGGTVQTVGGVNVTASTQVTNGTLNASSYNMSLNNPNFYCSLGGVGAAVTKSSGTLSLYGANTYTGDTTMNNCTLQLYFTSTFNPVNDIINSASALKLAGSTFTVNGMSTAGSQNRQTVNGLYVNAPGNSQLRINNGSSANSMLLNLGAITRQPGATVYFTQPNQNLGFGPTNGFKTTTTNDASGILGGWATVGSTPTDWAANNGTNIVAFTNYFTLTGTTPTIANNSASNVRISNASTGTVSLAASGTNTINTLLDKDTAARTNLIGVGNTLRLGAAGGILLPTGTGVLTIDLSGSAGTLTAGGADNTPGDLVINNASTVSNNAAIADNGTGAISLTKSGAGNLILTKACTHTGGTWVNAGALYLPGVANALVTNAPITILSAGPLDLGGGTLTNRVGVALHNANCVLTNGTLVLFGTNLDVWGGAITATLAGPGGLLKTTVNTLLLSNTVNNTYTGDTIVQEGTLTLGSEYALGGSTNIIVGAPGGGVTVTLNRNASINSPYKTGKNYTIYPNGYLDFTTGGGWLNGTLTIIGGLMNGYAYITIQSGASVKMTGGTFAGINNGASDYDITTFATSNTAVISATAYSMRTVTVARGTSPIDVTFSGSTTLRVIKAGPGVMAITAGQTYSGYTLVSAGTLLANNYMKFNTSGTGQGPVTNAVGATLGGLGTIGGVAGYSNANVFLASAASSATVSTLAPGNIDAITGNHVIGTLTVGSAIQTNNVTFGKYGRLYVTLGSAPPQCDCLAVNGSLNLGTTDNSAILDVAAGNVTPRTGNYTIASFNVLTGRFQMVRSAAGAVPSRYLVNYMGTSSGRGNELLNGSIVVSVPPMGSVILFE